MINPVEPSPISETTALSQILDWSLQRPNWQRDALRRLVQCGELNNEDYDELLAICLDTTRAFDPLSRDHIASESLPGVPISLSAVADVKGVNALAPEQELKLSAKGLTIVYGDNGSGKSGYVRILKHACRSRDTRNKVLPNVNDELTEIEQFARVSFQRGDELDHMNWSPQADGHADLPSISIFDTQSANTHLSGESDVAYIPFPMLLLERLALAADALNRKIKDRIEDLERQRPASLLDDNFDPNTSAGDYIRKLTAKSNLAKLDTLTTIADDEQRRHASLKSDFAQDPKTALARLRSLKSRMINYAETSKRLSSASSNEQIEVLRTLKEHMTHTAAVAKTASDKLFETSPLPNIGGPLWKSLWEAARSYSDQEVTDGEKFPKHISDEDICVLCQQPLGESVAQKWDTFEEFIKGTTKQDEQTAKQRYQETIQQIKQEQIGTSKLKSLDTLVRNEVGNIPLADAIRRCAITANWRLRAMLEGRFPSETAPSIPDDEISKAISEIDLRITQLSADENSEMRKAMRKEFSELEERIRLQTLKADVILHIDRLKQIVALKKASKDTAKRSVTEKAKELSDQLVTASLRSRFAREVEKLQIGTMPIELKKERDRNGKSWFKIALVGTPSHAIGEVLSEGEHRCVALAAFLAELVTAKEYSGIVFDDPMSSLDHLYRSKVATRLVEEAEHRQVIVFTHDLSFLFELSNEAERQDQTINYQTVMRRSRKPGFIDDDLPMKAKDAKSMALAIKTHLKSLKGRFDSMSLHERETNAKGIIAHMRESWEQGIADYIKPVLKRFDSKIHPSSLSQLLVLTPEDVKTVRAAYGRLSEDIHATPETLNPADVEYNDLNNEVQKLDEWLIDLSKRQSQLRKRNRSSGA